MGEPKSRRRKRPAPPKPAGPPQRQVIQVGRNEACPCGSGKKYKHCHEAEGQVFLSKLTYERQRKETWQRLKDEGVPWYRRLLAVR